MATVNLSARDIDLIGRVVDTEVPRSIARRNPQEYARMVGAVVDTITNRLASNRYGNTIESVLNEHRAFSKITGPKRLDPYGSVAKAPKATYTAQTAVNDHIKGRIAGMPSIIGGALDYANPHFSDRKNLRGWVQPMIDAGAKALGIGNAVHYHGVAPGNFPAPPTDIHGPAGWSTHRGPPGEFDPSSPMRPDEANAAGPKGIFSVTPSYAAPLGEVTKGPELAPASLLPDRPMPMGPVRPTDFSSLSISQPAYAGVAPVPPTEVRDNFISPVPGVQASPTVSPTPALPEAPAMNEFPAAPAAPSKWDKFQYAAKPVAKNALIGNMLAGPLGALGGAAIGLMGDRLPGFSDLVGPGFDAAAPDRFSTGFGLPGITAAMGGPLGAQGFSASNPGMSFTSLGNGMGLRRSDRFGWTEVVGPGGEVRGIQYDNPNQGGLLGSISRAMGKTFGGSGKNATKAERASFAGKAGLY